MVNNDIKDINYSSEQSPDTEPVYRIKVIEENEDQPTFITNQEGPPSEQRLEEEQQEEITINWPNEVKYSDDLVYRIQVINYRDALIKCNLKFRIDDGVPPEEVNLFFPEGGFKAVVPAKDNKTVLLLHKLRPQIEQDENNELNKLTTEFYYKDKYIKGSSVPSSGDYQPLRNRNVSQVHPMADDKNADVKISLNDSNIANVSQEDSHDSKDQWQENLFDQNNAVIVPTKEEAEKATTDNVNLD